MQPKEAYVAQTDLEKNSKLDDDLTNRITSSFVWQKVHLATAAGANNQIPKRILDEVSGDAAAGSLRSRLTLTPYIDLV